MQKITMWCHVIAAAAFACANVSCTASADSQAPLPSIRALVTPPPNAAGWNNTAIIVTFECQHVVACPEDIVVDAEGEQHVTKTVDDGRGHRASVNVQVRIDTTPGLVRVTRSGDQNSPWMSITASVTDDVSGIASASCNGQPVSIESGTITCTIPMHDGLTDVALTAMDVAGNSSSAALQFRRRATIPTITVIPDEATVAVRMRRPLQLVDSAGDPIGDAVWTSDDPLIARVDANGFVVGLSEGRTRIHASADGRTASMTLSVVTSLSTPGTTLWRLKPSPGATGGIMPGFDGVLFSIAHDAAGHHAGVQVMKNSGELLWNEFAAMAPNEQVKEWMGSRVGVLLWVEEPGQRRSAIVRIGRASDDKIWRYECDGPATAYWAMDWTGTLYVVETAESRFSRVTGIDSNTGAVKFRAALPSVITLNPDAASAALRAASPAQAGPATIPDGREAAVQFVLNDVVLDDAAGGVRKVRRRVNLMRLDPSGKTRVQPLTEFIANSEPELPTIRLHFVVPDGHDALLALMRLEFADGRVEGRVVRLLGDARTSYQLPTAGEYVLGEDWAYTTDGRTLVAFDPASGAVQWSHRSDSEPFELLYAVHGGGVSIRQGDVVQRLNGAGTVVHAERHSKGMQPILP